jgi:uncharacterized protein YkwD
MCGERWMSPVRAVTWDRRLERSALLHAKDMAAKNYFSHDSLDGRSFGVRIKQAGFSFSVAGENIAWREDAVIVRVMQDWVESKGHCRAMMKGDYERVGIAFARAPGSRRVYWVMDLGTLL